MKLVVDANILFAALIKEGLTISLLFDNNVQLFTPEFIFEEFLKHEHVILQVQTTSPISPWHSNSTVRSGPMTKRSTSKTR